MGGRAGDGVAGLVVGRGPGAGGAGDRPLRAASPDEVVEAAIDATGTREQRRRRLPTRLVVAMGQWATESMWQALAAVVEGWREGDGARRTGWRLPCAALELATERLPPRRPREYPRVVKRKMSKYLLNPPHGTAPPAPHPSPLPPPNRILRPEVTGVGYKRRV
jgi:Insertion element 4 transposase N-terminal